MTLRRNTALSTIRWVRFAFPVPRAGLRRHNALWRTSLSPANRWIPPSLSHLAMIKGAAAVVNAEMGTIGSDVAVALARSRE